VSWLTWDAIKLFVKKAWVWSKHHWKIIALVIWTIAVWTISRKRSKTMMKVLDTARKSYEAEIDALVRHTLKSRQKKQKQLTNTTK